MPSININPDFFTHIKTKRLQTRLGPGSEIYLIRLWCIACRYDPEAGEFAGWTAAELEDQVDWNGEREAMVNAMMDVGFLHKTSKGYYIHDWQEHEGHLKSYRDKARAAHEARRKKKKEAQANAQEVAEEIAQANAQEVEDSHTMQCNAMQCNTTTLARLREHRAADGEETIVTSKVVERKTLSASTVQLAQNVFGNFGEQAVMAWAHNTPEDWIVKAIQETAIHAKNQTHAKATFRAIMTRYKEEGGPTWKEGEALKDKEDRRMLKAPSVHEGGRLKVSVEDLVCRKNTRDHSERQQTQT